jgi:hypothetical protein
MKCQMQRHHWHPSLATGIDPSHRVHGTQVLYGSALYGKIVPVVMGEVPLGRGAASTQHPLASA